MRTRNPFTEEKNGTLPEYKPEMSVLDCFDIVAKHAEDCELSETFLQNLHPFLECVATALGVSHYQVLFLCAFLSGNRSSIGKNDLRSFFSCSSVRVVRLWDEVEDLCTKGYLTRAEGRRGSTNAEYVLSEDGITSLRRGQPIERKENKNLTNSQYINVLRRIISQKRHSSIPDDDFADHINGINEENVHLHMANEICNTDLDVIQKAMLTYVIHRTLLTNGDTFDVDDMTRVFDDDCFGLTQELVRGEHVLIRDHYIQNASNEGLVRKDVFELTDSTRERFLKEFTLSTTDSSDVTGLIMPETITQKELFYAPEDDHQIASLGNLLTEEKISAIRERLEQAGMRKGFCCLFYGAPGTGKTETALQLARQTGRAIMQVDFSQTRDMWYGNTEKNIKRIFTDYRNMVRQTKLMPILLFNEADAILSVRQTMGGNSHATDKTENAIQNIILQEMESFDGIMIATTNLTMNLDKAFERRFLYKVEFHKPTLEAKQQIWHSMLPQVDAEVVHRLSLYYDLSGGQIENVVRKYMVHTILYGPVEDDYVSLNEFCHQETLSSTEGKKIGFE